MVAKQSARPVEVDIWLPLYIGDWVTETMHLTSEQEGAYLRLFLHFWKTGAPLPDDDELLARVTRLSTDAWTKNRNTLAAFFVVENKQWRRQKWEALRTEANANKARKSEAGRKGAQGRWPNREITDAVALQTQSPSPLTETSPSSETASSALPSARTGSEHVPCSGFSGTILNLSSEQVADLRDKMTFLHDDEEFRHLLLNADRAISGEPSSVPVMIRLTAYLEAADSAAGEKNWKEFLQRRDTERAGEEK